MLGNLEKYIHYSKDEDLRDKKILKTLNEAKKAQNSAYAKYSNFHVGASILTKKGELVSGFNIENESYSMTLCAERVALSSYMAQGYKLSDIEMILIVGQNKDPISPCGACREFMSEFIDNNVEIFLAGNGKHIAKTNIGTLLPYKFRM